MSHIPSFTMYHPFDAVPLPNGAQQSLHEVMVDKLDTDPGVEVERARILKLLRPFDEPRAPILGYYELQKFHEDIGVAPTQSQVEKLKQAVQASIAKPDTHNYERIPITEIAYQRSRKHSGGILRCVVTKGEMIPERRKAVKAVGEFYDVSLEGTALEGFHDHVTTVIARGKTVWEAKIMSYARNQARAGALVLPRVVVGPLESTPVK